MRGGLLAILMVGFSAQILWADETATGVPTDEEQSSFDQLVEPIAEPPPPPPPPVPTDDSSPD